MNDTFEAFTFRAKVLLSFHLTSMEIEHLGIAGALQAGIPLLMGLGNGKHVLSASLANNLNHKGLYYYYHYYCFALLLANLLWESN